MFVCESSSGIIALSPKHNAYKMQQFITGREYLQNEYGKPLDVFPTLGVVNSGQYHNTALGSKIKKIQVQKSYGDKVNFTQALSGQTIIIRRQLSLEAAFHQRSAMVIHQWPPDGSIPFSLSIIYSHIPLTSYWVDFTHWSWWTFIFFIVAFQFAGFSLGVILYWNKYYRMTFIYCIREKTKYRQARTFRRQQYM